MSAAGGPSETGRGPVHTVHVGLVGKGIQGSRTPAMHMAEGTAQGIAYRYDLIDVDAMETPVTLREIVERAEADGFAGLNITFPFKKDVIGFVDHLSDNARKVGAVNTVVFKDGQRFGHNTDFWGFAESLRRGLGEADRRHVLLLGAGGAGGALAHALLSLGVVDLMIADNNEAAAAALADQVGGRVAVDMAEAANRADGIVNATPMGMAKMPGTAIDPALLQARHWVNDIVYFPLETELLRQARLRGCRVLSGAGMAVFQAVRAFELFTGLEADPARMRLAFEAFAKTD
ncbi:shikimate dehydrogenase [Martelella alba]|uniref:Shikimate dehydrogenase (NADP(+)) n=1 Tax=Martelella alba TaxID=2590451 RepID=A0A506UFX5_9HYPH|nr:shikimate dehydrogenase [Martelella alba]TPW31829.1 shikimate dehydrogenase [Martelella alba]